MTELRTIEQVEAEIEFHRLKLADHETKLVNEHDYEWTLRRQIEALELQLKRLMGIRPEG